MAIEGIGVDLVEVRRIEKAMQDEKFLERILTPAERRLNLNPLRVAGRWAAKEAIAKALSVELSWQDVEILNDQSGKPVATVTSPSFSLKGKCLHISITHENGNAAAFAILESIDEPPIATTSPDFNLADFTE